MIRMRYEEGLACPTFFCDGCGEPIDDPKAANCEWVMKPEDWSGTERDGATLYHVHKGCSWAHEARLGQGPLANIGLDDFLVQLLTNTGWTPVDLARHRAALSEWGGR